jgi:ribonuclease HI
MHREPMEKEKKYYAVWKGRARGIFDTWEQCLAHVRGYPGAQYMAFPSREAARRALEQPYELARAFPADYRALRKNAPVMESIAVDGSCPGNPGPVEFRGVHVGKGIEVFRQGPFANGTNNIGEFLAIVDALKYLHQKNKAWPVYSDSETAIGWVQGKHCRTRIAASQANAALIKMIRQAEDWLRVNDYPNPVLKWETSDWGENPADYRRK